MRAVQVLQTGRGLDGLSMAERPEPVPGPGELLVRVEAVSASRLDLLMLNGATFGNAVTLPRTLGGDPAGRVEAVGEGTSTARLGQRVVVKPNLFCGHCERCAAGHEADCRDQPVLGLHRDGGAADLVTVPERSAFVLPDALSFQVGAAAVHTVPVALHMIRVAGGVETGTPVVVTGAAGAVGSAAVQLVRALGGKALAVVQDAAQEAFVAALEPHAIIRLDRTGLAAGVRQVAPDGAALAVDTTGVAAVFPELIDALGWGGHAVTCAGAPGARPELSLSDLYRLRRTVHGAAASECADVNDGLDLVARGAVTPQIGVVVPLPEFRMAYGAVTDASRNGKVLMEVSS